MDRKILFDLETTGLYPKEGHKIVEVAFIEIFDDCVIGNHFHTLVNPQRDIPDEVVKVHNVDNQKVIDAPIFADIADKIIDFINDSYLIAHNAKFDQNFLNYELQQVGKNIYYDDSKIIDTLLLANFLFSNVKSNSLDALCERFDISLSEREYHNALVDTQLLAKVYQKLVTIQKKQQQDLDDKMLIYYPTKKFDYRSFLLPDHFIKDHNCLLEKIPNNLWYKSNKGDINV